MSLDDIVAMLVRVFVDASPHIPEHRQLPLFAHLISTVGSTKFLHAAIILLLEKHVVLQGPTTPDEKQVHVTNLLLLLLLLLLFFLLLHCSFVVRSCLRPFVRSLVSCFFVVSFVRSSTDLFIFSCVLINF